MCTRPCTRSCTRLCSWPVRLCTQTIYTYTAVFAAVYTPMYTAVYTARTRPCTRSCTCIRGQYTKRIEFATFSQTVVITSVNEAKHYILLVTESLLWPPCVADADIIFLSCFFVSFFFLFSSPNPRRRRLDVYRIAKNSLSGHHRTTLSGYIFATTARIDNRKKLLKQQYLLYVSLQYG